MSLNDETRVEGSLQGFVTEVTTLRLDMDTELDAESERLIGESPGDAFKIVWPKIQVLNQLPEMLLCQIPAADIREPLAYRCAAYGAQQSIREKAHATP